MAIADGLRLHPIRIGGHKGFRMICSDVDQQGARTHKCAGHIQNFTAQLHGAYGRIHVLTAAPRMHQCGFRA